MPTFGPFPVSKGDVFTNIRVQGDDILDITALGWVSFARVVGRTFDADGDDWSTPTDFPAPALRKHSLIVRFGSGPWFQGGKSRRIIVPPSQSGEVILRTNDHDDWLWDNDNTWAVTIVHTRPEPSPAPPGPVIPALQITSLELVQAIQRNDNSVPLVRGKRTVVRVFVDSGFRNGQNTGAGPNRWANVSGSLRILDATNSSPIASVTTPLNEGGTITALPGAEMDREQWDHSLNFELPPNAINASVVDIEATVTTPLPAGLPPQSTRRAVRVRFRPRAPQPLLPVLIRLTNPAIASDEPSSSDFCRLVERVVVPRFPVAENGFVIRPEFVWVTANDLRQQTHWNGLRHQLATVRLLSSNPVDGIRCGLVPVPSTLTPLPTGGIGAPRVWGSQIPTFVVPISIPINFAHELGHAFGIWHSQCRGDEGGYDRRDMPGRIDDVGLNVATSQVIPRNTPDVMSYCLNGERQWCSVQFYETVFSEGVI